MTATPGDPFFLDLQAALAGTCSFERELGEHVQRLTAAAEEVDAAVRPPGAPARP